MASIKPKVNPPSGVSAVKMENPRHDKATILRAFHRSAISPPGNWKIVYPARKEESTTPNWALFRPRAGIITGAATEILTRSMKLIIAPTASNPINLYLIGNAILTLLFNSGPLRLRPQPASDPTLVW